MIILSVIRIHIVYKKLKTRKIINNKMIKIYFRSAKIYCMLIKPMLYFLILFKAFIYGSSVTLLLKPKVYNMGHLLVSLAVKDSC